MLIDLGHKEKEGNPGERQEQDNKDPYLSVSTKTQGGPENSAQRIYGTKVRKKSCLLREEIETALELHGKSLSLFLLCVPMRPPSILRIKTRVLHVLSV